MVDEIQPKPGDRICAPACGTGGFLLVAHDFVAKHYPNASREDKKKLKADA